MENKTKRLGGARFELIDCNGCPIACGTTDEKGLLCFDELPLGTYFLREIDAPCGYRPCRELIKVEICCKEPCKTVEVMNERIKGQITVVKLGC